MIQVLLLILKIIGITLLVLLLTVLFLLALVLFVPIRYRARVIHNPEKDDIYGRASFLFPLVVFRFRFYEKVFSYKGRALWYVFAESGKNKEEPSAKKNKGVKKEEPEKKAAVQAEPEAVSESVADESDAEETKEILEKIKPVSSSEEPETAEKKKKPKKEKAPKKSLAETLKKLLRQKDEVVRILSKQESKDSIRFAWDKLKKTIRHIVPRKVKGYLIFGSDDPATTGQVLGIVSVLYAAMGPVLKIVPDFENKRLECDLEFRGRLRVFTLLVILLKIYFNKELKQLIEEIKSIKEIE